MAFNVDKIFPPKSDAEMQKSAKRNTICETLRLVYKDINSGKLEKAKYKLRVAVTMAKAMDKKLKEYNRPFSRNLFPKKEKK